MNKLTIKSFFFLISMTLLMLSCDKNNINKNVSNCIKSYIKVFQKTACNKNAKVDEYKFQGKIVYVFEPGICGADRTSEVKDNECNTLGYLSGISGNIKINGEDFSNSTYIRTVWEN